MEEKFNVVELLKQSQCIPCPLELESYNIELYPLLLDSIERMKNVATSDYKQLSITNIKSEFPIWRLYRNLLAQFPSIQEYFYNNAFHIHVRGLLDALLSPSISEDDNKVALYLLSLAELVLYCCVNYIVQNKTNQHIFWEYSFNVEWIDHDDDTIMGLILYIWNICILNNDNMLLPMKDENETKDIVYNLIKRETEMSLDYLLFHHPNNTECIDNPVYNNKNKSEEEEVSQSDSFEWFFRMVSIYLKNDITLFSDIISSSSSSSCYFSTTEILFISYILSECTHELLQEDDINIMQHNNIIQQIKNLLYINIQCLNNILNTNNNNNITSESNTQKITMILDNMKITGCIKEQLYRLICSFQLILGCCTDFMTKWTHVNSPIELKNNLQKILYNDDINIINIIYIIFYLCESQLYFSDLLPEPQTGPSTLSADIKKQEAVFASPFSCKTYLLQFIATIVYETPQYQIICGNYDIIPIVMNQCRYDKNNPWKREWAIFSLKNLTYNCIGNQEIVQKMKLQGVQNLDELKNMGVTAAYDASTGKISLSSADMIKDNNGDNDNDRKTATMTEININNTIDEEFPL